MDWIFAIKYHHGHYNGKLIGGILGITLNRDFFPLIIEFIKVIILVTRMFV